MSVDILWTESKPAELWEEALNKLMEKLPQSAFYAWFLNLEITHWENNTVCIGTPNNFVLDYIAQHYKTIIGETLKDILGQEVQLKFTNLDRACNSVYEADDPGDITPPEPESHSQEAPLELGTIIDSSLPLCTGYTFNQFVVGDCNQMAHAACMAVAESPRHNNFNPLILYGGTGMGKTHLLQAVGHYVQDAETAKKVVYRASEEFIREYIHYVHKKKDSRKFYEVYRDADVLLIDDIQFLAGKKSTQEEFFNIFNNLLYLNKQIILTSDRLPYEIQGLHKRLLSRFDRGLLANLQPPKMETRLAILKKKMEQNKFEFLSYEVLSYLANSVTSNVRALEGTLVKLTAYASFKKLPITVEIAQEILGDTLRNVNKPVNLQAINNMVGQFFDIPPSQLSSHSRKKNVAIPRQVAMYLARKLTDNSLHTIGLAFGRDYSTVIHSLKKIEQSLETDPSLRETIGVLKERIQNQARENSI